MNRIALNHPHRAPNPGAAEIEGVDAMGPTNAMTVDVEDYFQVSAFEGHVSRDDWDRVPQRVEGRVDRILQLFATAGCAGPSLPWDGWPSAIRRWSGA